MPQPSIDQNKHIPHIDLSPAQAAKFDAKMDRLVPLRSGESIPYREFRLGRRRPRLPQRLRSRVSSYFRRECRYCHRRLR